MPSRQFGLSICLFGSNFNRYVAPDYSHFQITNNADIKLYCYNALFGCLVECLLLYMIRLYMQEIILIFIIILSLLYADKVSVNNLNKVSELFVFH